MHEEALPVTVDVIAAKGWGSHDRAAGARPGHYVDHQRTSDGRNNLRRGQLLKREAERKGLEMRYVG